MEPKDYGTSEQSLSAGEASALPGIERPQWWEQLDTRDMAQVRHAVEYASAHQAAGVPGHSQFMLIAKLWRQLKAAEQRAASAPERVVVKRVTWSEGRDGAPGCWRDLTTGVRVEW